MEIVDSYLHCGLTKFEPIERVREVIAAAAVSRAVIVQHLGEFDNSYIQRIVAQEPDRIAGVCMVDHTVPQAEPVLRDLAGEGRFRGVRITAEALTEAPDLVLTAFRLGLVVVLYTPDGLANNVNALVRVLDQHPDGKVVISHLGNPNPDESPAFDRHLRALRLAEYRNVYFQVSGMKMFCPYPHQVLYPIIEMAAERFGGSRLLWGSNFPVVGGADDYVRDLALLTECRTPIPNESIHAVTGENALQLWFS
jgi:predicted TIM-barrel fold metal-dependent hydrolase